MDKSLSCEFSFYDLNLDGNITTLEFNTALENELTFEEAYFSFLQTDANGLITYYIMYIQLIINYII